MSVLNAIVDAQKRSPGPYLLKPNNKGPEASTLAACQEPGQESCQKMIVKTKQISVKKLKKPGKTISFRPELDVVMKVETIFVAYL